MADVQPVAERQNAPVPRGNKFKRWLHGKNSWFARFARQDLRGWTPILSARFVVFAYLLAAVVLLLLGIAILVASLNVQQHSVSVSGRCRSRGTHVHRCISCICT